jgi:hypothetical protein
MASPHLTTGTKAATCMLRPHGERLAIRRRTAGFKDRSPAIPIRLAGAAGWIRAQTTQQPGVCARNQVVSEAFLAASESEVAAS